MPGQAPTIAIFGATGGCGNAALVHALRAGHHVVTLARTPSKLTSLLQAQGIADSVLDSQLTIVTGDALDKDKVKQTITAGRASYLVSHILTALGGAPNMTWSVSKPLQFFTVDQPTICGDAARTLLAAMVEVNTEYPELKSKQPTLTFISTTGISRGTEDVPFGLRTLYHKALAEPHKDKRDMENTYRDNKDGKDAHGSLFADIVGVRPTLLTGEIKADSGVGLRKVRAGTEAAPQTGWTIARADVGEWIAVNVLDESKRTQWANQMVSLAS